jgi:hypothetical protein
MSNDFTKRGANAYTEDIVEFGVFHHVSGLGVGDGRIDELDPMLLTLGEGCVSRAVFCALSEGVRKETSLCWLSMSTLSVHGSTIRHSMIWRACDPVHITEEEWRLPRSRQPRDPLTVQE